MGREEVPSRALERWKRSEKVEPPSSMRLLGLYYESCSLAFLAVGCVTMEAPSNEAEIGPETGSNIRSRL